MHTGKRGHTHPHRLISRIQLEMVDLGVMMMWGPLTPRDSFRNASSEMDMRVLPRPISSAKILCTCKDARTVREAGKIDVQALVILNVNTRFQPLASVNPVK